MTLPLASVGVAIKLTCMTHLHFVRGGQKSSLITQQLAMSCKCFSSLGCPAQRRYLERLKIDGETLSDLYAVAEDLWTNDVSSWPNFESWDLYNCLIDSTGQFTKEKLREFKLLEAYNYFTMVACRRYSSTRVNTILLS